ncbi:hypothetical protein JOQ06_007826 [Pogonophryne albipinna]|uniref:Uncharacterized protein n=1 Tax=Pogonophryne albipinna TaxID=1090488 RepID=A0AAD6FIL3_9TELE|nr:hypothetical protein JOQ06_007826 [Pogonophryne albipinna]
MPVVHFTIIIDGTQDISGVEQECALCRCRSTTKGRFPGNLPSVINNSAKYSQDGMWTVRTPAIRSVLKQYESVLMALEEMASCSSPETSAKANGLHGTFLKGNF